MMTTSTQGTKPDNALRSSNVHRRYARFVRYALLVLPGLGLLVVIALAGITTERVRRGAFQPNNSLGRIEASDTMGQTFVVEADQLVAIRVRLEAGTKRGTEPVTLHLRFPDPALPDLASATIPVDAISNTGMTTFAFEPVTLDVPPGVLTTTLRFDLVAPTLAPGDGITVLGDRDLYPGGEFFKSNTAIPAIDMAFEPIYRQRWIDRLLPISRMAHGKPGLLGWPRFYALIAYVFILTLVLAIIRLWRAIHSTVDVA